jgi:xanthine dehydrogenase YagS FAD-binding subunit
MHNFEYASPTTKEQAVSLLGSSWGETEALAGGTDLLALLKDYVVTPKRVVNLKGIKELDGISYTAAKGLRLGALVTFEEMLDNAAIKSSYPAIWQAVAGVTSPQIRNMGTVRSLPAPALLVFPRWLRPVAQGRRRYAACRHGRQPLPRDFGQ